MEMPKLWKCDLIDLHRFLGKKWAFALFTNIGLNPVTFNELFSISKHKINPTLLSDRLKEMRKLGIIKKEVMCKKKVYRLTVQGEELKKILNQIKNWSEKSGHCIPEECKGRECVCKKVFEQ